jgi:exonuclease SbcC
LSAADDERETERLLEELARQVAETRTKAELSRERLEQAVSITLHALPGTTETLEKQTRLLAESCREYGMAASDAASVATKKRDQAFDALQDVLRSVALSADGELDEVLADVANMRDEAHAEAVRAEATVALLKEKIKKRGDLERKIKEDTARCARYRTLGQELHQDRFIAFVLAESMERLAALASVELSRISGERYSLIAEEAGFDVVDHHNADEQRAAATLSGGETFLASLALALALAGSVRDLAGAAAAARLDAIFIDEGFGALDPETLDVVVDALERLREGERMVGVISHVEALAERIPRGLIVTKNGGVSTVAARQ